MAIKQYADRDLGSSARLQSVGVGIWPAVEIIKDIPGHPMGSIRYPRPEQREQWIRQGVCRVVPQSKRGGRRGKRKG